QNCFVCGESGATITCQGTDCDRSFHFPCAVEGECVTQYLSQYSSFCPEHRPEQQVEAAPEEDTTCPICLEPVGDRKSYGTPVSRSLRASHLHLVFLLQGQAACAGIFCFQCPLCRNRETFLAEMLLVGIRVPIR
ncbi:G2/M phase-specific E3 ubiquitin-protein ligase, partial [Tauraco erythrolophus]